MGNNPLLNRIFIFFNIELLILNFKCFFSLEKIVQASKKLEFLIK